MELFLLEHKKLWRKTSVRISVLVCVIYMVIFGAVLNYQWFDFGSWRNGTSSAFGNNFDGYSMIRAAQEQGGSYGGYLTDESLRRMVDDYQARDAANARIAPKDGWGTIDGYISQLWPELEDPAQGFYAPLMLHYVDSAELSGLYERRQAVLEQFLQANFQTGEEAQMLLAMNEKVAEPFRYEWAQGWQRVLAELLPDLCTIMALFLAVVLSPTFSGEWHNNTAPLMLTTNRGRKSVALVKVLSGLAFSAELFVLLAAGTVAAQLIYLGASGWDMPIQIIKLIAVAPWNMLQAEIYEYAFVLLGALGFAGVVMLLSALVKSNVLALLCSLAVVYVPSVIAGYLPYGAQKLLDLIPMVGSADDIFRTNTVNLFGKYIWSPYLLVTVPVLIGLACTPFAVMRWSRRQNT